MVLIQVFCYPSCIHEWSISFYMLLKFLSFRDSISSESDEGPKVASFCNRGMLHFLYLIDFFFFCSIFFSPFPFHMKCPVHYHSFSLLSCLIVFLFSCLFSVTDSIAASIFWSNRSIWRFVLRTGC